MIIIGSVIQNSKEISNHHHHPLTVSTQWNIFWKAQRDLLNVVTLERGTNRSLGSHPPPAPCRIPVGPGLRFRVKQKAQVYLA